MPAALLDEARVNAPPEPKSTNFLGTERALLERFMPGLDAEFKAIPLAILEGRENPSIRILKDAKGPGLLIPKQYGGLGASAVEGARTLRAIASRAPSLGIVCTMHNFSASTLVEWAMFGEEYGEMLLTGLAENSMYRRLGLCRGPIGVQAPRHDHAGPARSRRRLAHQRQKKPCTLTYSMDFLSCGVSVEADDGTRRRAIGLVPADSAGIERRPFWKSHVLAGAESDEVILTDVHVPDDFVFVIEGSDQLDPVEVTGYVWFQIAPGIDLPRHRQRPGGTACSTPAKGRPRSVAGCSRSSRRSGGRHRRHRVQPRCPRGPRAAAGTRLSRPGSLSRGPSRPSPCGPPSSLAAWRSSAPPRWPISCAHTGPRLPPSLAASPPAARLDEYARGGVLDVS